MDEVKLVTPALAMSQESEQLYAAPHDVLNRGLDFFNVDSEDKDHGEKVDALVGLLDDMADPDAAIPAPSSRRLAQKTALRRVSTGW